jgi:hypothetical protein
VATVTSSRLLGNLDLKHRETISRLKNSLTRFCLAAGHVQAAGLCCDSFTIPCLLPQHADQPFSSDPLVEVHQIEFRLLLQLLTELEYLSNVDVPSSIDVMEIGGTVSQILGPSIQGTTSAQSDASVSGSFHFCSLAVQVTCSGFSVV